MLLVLWSSPGAALGFFRSQEMWLGEGTVSHSPFPAPHPRNFPPQPEPGSGHLLIFYQQLGLEAKSPAELLREVGGCKCFLL